MGRRMLPGGCKRDQTFIFALSRSAVAQLYRGMDLVQMQLRRIESEFGGVFCWCL